MYIWVTNLSNARKSMSSAGFQARFAKKQAEALRLGKPVKQQLSPLRLAAESSLPMMILAVVTFVYVFCIGPLYQAVNSRAWKIGVYCFVLCVVKTGEEKLLVVLLRRAARRHISWSMVFCSYTRW